MYPDPRFPRLFGPMPDGKMYCWKSDHPLEERCIEMTDDYKDAEGNWIIPEAVEWDGVETCPGILLGPVEEE